MNFIIVFPDICVISFLNVSLVSEVNFSTLLSLVFGLEGI